MVLAMMITWGQSRPWSDRYLFSVFQRLSTTFNTVQHPSTLEGLARKNHAEKRSDELMAG